MPDIRTVHSIEHWPRPGDLAGAWGNDLPVVATPVLLWLTELCAVELLEPLLGEGQMSVGTGHQSRHLAPALASPSLEVEACLEALEPHRATFKVIIKQAGRMIVAGTHTRAIICRARFLARLDELRPPVGGA